MHSVLAPPEAARENVTVVTFCNDFYDDFIVISQSQTRAQRALRCGLDLARMYVLTVFPMSERPGAVVVMGDGHRCTPGLCFCGVACGA